MREDRFSHHITGKPHKYLSSVGTFAQFQSQSLCRHAHHPYLLFKSFQPCKKSILKPSNAICSGI